jgi:hypothetical protein
MSQEHNDTEAVRNRLLEKATADGAFRQRLLAHPKATIEQELGLRLGPDLSIEVVEETPSRICLVLPARTQAGDGVELSDNDLQNVAGGTLPIPLPRPVCGFDRLSNVLEQRAQMVGLTPIQIP